MHQQISRCRQAIIVCVQRRAYRAYVVSERDASSIPAYHSECSHIQAILTDLGSEEQCAWRTMVLGQLLICVDCHVRAVLAAVNEAVHVSPTWA